MMKKLLAALPLLLALWSPAWSAEADQYCYNPNWTTGGINTWVPCPSVTITGNATGTTGAVVGTLAAAVGKTTYICGFVVSAVGGTATVGPITIAGLVGGSAVYYLTSSVAGSTLAQSFAPCIPGSAVNTAITITTTADGSASAVTVNSWGYQM